MQKLLSLIVAGILFGYNLKAQTTAQDFTRIDCDGNTHHLFSELDSGNVVIMEFIMTCSSCVAAGHALETMMADLEMQYPGKVRFYQFAYTNSYSCATMQSFKSSNGFSSAVFDSGAAMVAYYGGFGMPTVAIAAGNNHDVLLSNVGFGPSDTTQAGNEIRSFFNTLNVKDESSQISSFNSYPNPANDLITVELFVKKNCSVSIQITDLNGKVVKEELLENVNAGLLRKDLTVSSLAAGYYMIKATVDGTTTINKINISR